MNKNIECDHAWIQPVLACNDCNYANIHSMNADNDAKRGRNDCMHLFIDLKDANTDCMKGWCNCMNRCLGTYLHFMNRKEKSYSAKACSFIILLNNKGIIFPELSYQFQNSVNECQWMRRTSGNIEIGF